MIDLIFYFFYAVLCSFSAFAYIIILLDADMVLGGLYRWLKPKMEKTIVTRFLIKPLLDCVHCCAGQISLWVYFDIYGLENYNVFLHIGFIATSITITHILYKKIGTL